MIATGNQGNFNSLHGAPLVRNDTSNMGDVFMNPSNYSSISFPFLGIEVNPPRTLSIGPLTAHYYGLIIAIGLFLAIGYACKRS